VRFALDVLFPISGFIIGWLLGDIQTLKTRGYSTTLEMIGKYRNKR
jgi:peptidoglycan/LPS O-acetylase OafA/YrhL